MEQKTYLTLDQVADLLQVSTETVRSYLKRKQNPLAYYKLGKEYRVARADFDEWMERNRGKPDEPR